MGVLKMSAKERKRMKTLSQVQEGTLKLMQAAELSGLSYRQTKRVWKRYREEGDKGLIHRGRGQASNRKIGNAFREGVLARCRDRYPDFGPTLASEYLGAEGLRVDHETLRRWLMEAGQWTKKRKRQQHRQWRERRAHCGELAQMDGSHHDWFEGRREWAVLMVMIDDATNRTDARLYESEDTRAAFDLFARYARSRGLPYALYVDRDSIYTCTREARIDEELRGEGPETQFGRAMKTLAVEVILANSPQAKGRVERRNGVFQDRLVKAMRLAGIRTLEEANRFLETTFLPELNRRFHVAAREPGDVHRSIPPGIRLKDVLCFEEPRIVQNDWTVRWKNRFFQIAPAHESLSLAKRRITVRERLDGSLALIYRNKSLRFTEHASRPARPPPVRALKAHAVHPPSADHPWRKYPALAHPRPPPSSDELYDPFSEGGGRGKTGLARGKGDISNEF